MLRREVVALALTTLVCGGGCAKVGGGGGAAPPPTPQPQRDAAIIDLPPAPDYVPVARDTCGNGLQDPGEGCDDHNTVGGDGCTALCQLEVDWACDTWGAPCVRTARCGDGRLSSNEECDDANTTSGDGCSADCQLETGWQCRVAGKRCIPLCGDGMIVGTETCDDGNMRSGDGCSSTCLKEPGATCPMPGQLCTSASCGNGIKEEGESCDAGNLNGLFFGNAMGCSKTCTKEPRCRDGATTRACDVTCGNGNIEANEQCDDGNTLDGDGCSATCTVEGGFTCMPEGRPDTQPCLVPGNTGQCLRLPAIFRDFKSEKEVGGHPDFFYLGNGTGTTSATRRVCVSNSGGPAKLNDSTARCWDIAQATLDANGKPAFNPLRLNGNQCDCQFTDWSHDTNGGHVPGYTIANSPLNAYSGAPALQFPAGHPSFHGLATIVKDATSFGQWFVDSTFTNNTHTVSTLELGPVAGSTSPYQFASPPNAVLGGFFPIDPPGTTPPPGVVRMAATGEPLLCNLWPYWFSSTAFGAGAGCRGDQYLFPPSVDALTPGCMNQVPPPGGVVCGNGMWVTAMQGTFHNFWFSTEVRYLFAFSGPFELQFYGDDDLFIFINGVLALDLGGVHQRLPGRVQVADTGIATITEGGALNPVTNVINPCPGTDPNTLQNTNATCPGGTCDCRSRTLDLHLALGSTYEIAVFHADRHPTESNFQLTLSGFGTTRSNCQSHCGDGVVTGGEECDDGAMNDDAAYAGCTTSCRFGPYCGDGTVNGPEQCDLGRNNVTPYGDRSGCTSGCTTPHFCGDMNVDAAYGEACDLGDGVNGTPGVPCDAQCHLAIQ